MNSTSIVWMENSQYMIDYPLIHCKDVYDITKVIGQLKSYFGSSRHVLFRGQASHYDFSQKPKIFRGKSKIEDIIPMHTIDAKSKNSFYEDYLEKLQDFTFELRKKQGRFDTGDLNFVAWEPVLQHYGLKSRYIDLVDNLNTALWFSVINWDNENKEFCISKEDYSYLFVYLAACTVPVSEGVFDGPDQRLVNLREALPAFALRPHIQQGYLLANHEFISFELNHYRDADLKLIERISDYNRFVLCSIRIETKYVLEYLGISKKDEQISTNELSFKNFRMPSVFSQQTIFPNPKIDELYRLLLYSQYEFDKHYMENTFEEYDTLELLSKYLKGDEAQRQELEIKLQKKFLGIEEEEDINQDIDREKYEKFIEDSIEDLLAWTGQSTYDIGRIDLLDNDFDQMEEFIHEESQSDD